MGSENWGSRVVGASAQGDANVEYRHSDEFRLSPRVVKSESKAKVFKSAFVMRITSRSPRRPYLV